MHLSKSVDINIMYKAECFVNNFLMFLRGKASVYFYGTESRQMRRLLNMPCFVPIFLSLINATF